MVRATRRPFGVTFAVIWGIVLAGLLAARAAGMGTVPAVFPESIASGLLLTAMQGAFALLLLLVATLVFRLTSWARRPAMFVFLLAGVATGATLVEFSMFGFVVVLLDAASLFMLAMYADVFRSKRPDIDDSGSATQFGL